MAMGARELLIERVQKMSDYELDKVIFYVASLEQEGGEPTLYISSEEEAELYSILESEDFIDGNEMFDQIMRMPNGS
ncbi:MAG: hypothetical protein FWB98_04375 [Defluviitaleaceae bacterium]|nr:hypothetical protein [Defluviitaleaceae bacterium]